MIFVAKVSLQKLVLSSNKLSAPPIGIVQTNRVNASPTPNKRKPSKTNICGVDVAAFGTYVAVQCLAGSNVQVHCVARATCQVGRQNLFRSIA